MSDAPDRDARTEEPTEKRILEARERGDTPVSSEVALAANFLVLAGSGALLATRLAAYLGTRLSAQFEHIADVRLDDGAAFVSSLQDIVSTMAIGIAPAVAALMIAGIVASVSQSGFVIGPDRLLPSLDRLSPARGLARIFGRNARGDLLKSLVKIGLGAVLVYVWLRREWPGLVEATATEPRGIVLLMWSGLTRLFVVFGLAHAVIAGADVAWVRLKWRLEHRMTKEEVKREHREAEMDPALKSRMRALANARARRRTMAAVPTATVVITNPTHLAIALRFVRERDNAPVVVAKGADLLALRIRERAAAHNVPIIEDRPLARAMFDLVEVDRAIPHQFYKAVAVIIHHLSRRGAVAPAPRR